jgi:hypothetical protein
LQLAHRQFQLIEMGAPGIPVFRGGLQRSGLIRYARGMVSILDHPGLSAMACECYRDHDRLLN